ncbi:SDR family NAD(P)-dependent oxidoreductase [Fretibacter rubidus]|uniref:SDR family NAD(P)-dependent oxidoreductase n=1 Tax=Fretibacter rubidus TaxID=570162 RepID=UPI00352ABAAB
MSKTTPLKSYVILGGTSAVAMAYARIIAADGADILLVGRNKSALADNVADLAARTMGRVSSYNCDLSGVSAIDKHWDAVKDAAGNIDSVFIAYGVLGDQEESQIDSKALAKSLQTNFTSAAIWAEKAFDHFAFQGHGKLTIIGSVAGDRGRQSNYHYGAAKGALEIFADGMAHRAAQTVGADINVLLVKPGFIDTPMTDHLDKGGPLWASPETIAKIIRRAERKGRSKIYAPWFWRFILLLIRMTPNFVFHKTKL